MGSKAYIAGVGMTPFGKHADRTLKSLGAEAIRGALKDADLDSDTLQAAYMGNAAAGVITGQVCVPGQVILRDMGIGGIPVVNVENACATAATAFQQAVAMVESGAYDIVLACGTEKLFSDDKLKTFSVFTGAVDVDEMSGVKDFIDSRMRDAGVEPPAGAGTSRSLFIDIYVSWALSHMKKYGTTRGQIAAVSAKNSFHGSLNPLAQYRDVLSVEDVLAARDVAWPLTLPMCSPIGDGAAAAILISEKKARELGLKRKIKVEASILRSGWDYSNPDEERIAERSAREVYELAGIGPQDIDCIELHDASAPSEIMYYEYLGLCRPGDGGQLVESGATRLGGRIPVNTSGGLLRKGHPIGATGLAQIYELVLQLRGEAGERQVAGAGTALAENGGGFIGSDAAAMAMTILSA
ncbi:MAG: thiolase family protein [Halioglobus sp.]